MYLGFVCRVDGFTKIDPCTEVSHAFSLFILPLRRKALLEAMEQQSISISKSGIIANLPARTSILAAANPIGGHYNRAKTVSENLKMSSALLSRFDLGEPMGERFHVNFVTGS